MNKFFYLLAALLLLTSCGAGKQHSVEPVQKDHDPNAIYYYSMAESAFQMKDLNSAASLFRKALAYEPESIAIKERLLEVLTIQAKYDAQLFDEIITVGESCSEKDQCTNRILIILAEAYSFTGDLEKGEYLLKKALQREPSLNLYLSYYLFRKNQLQDDDLSLLDRALKEKWTDLKTIMMIAEIYNSADPDSALGILHKAYNKWSEERVLRPLLGRYEKKGETEQIISLIQQHIAARRPTSDFLKEHLINLHFRTRNFQAVIDNQDICFELNKDPYLRYLFFSALSLAENELALQTAEIIEEQNDLPEEVTPLFHTYYGYVLFAENDFEKAAREFLLSNDINLVLEIIAEFGMTREVNAEELVKFSDAVLQQTEQIDMTHFLCGYLYALLDDRVNGLKYLNRISFQYLEENNLVETAAVLMLNLDDSNLSKVQELLAQRKNEVPSFNEIAGFYYYNTQQDSLAYGYFKTEFQTNSELSVRLITASVLLAEEFRDIAFIKTSMDIALKIYGEDPEIMNLYGYTIADLAIEEEYERAASLLNMAINLEPDNVMYWDSLSWLYFHLGKYRQALAAMEIPLQEEISNSEIAYHLGEIYLQLSETNKARKYLQLAVELDNEPDSVNLSRKLLEINDFKE